MANKINWFFGRKNNKKLNNTDELSNNVEQSKPTREVSVDSISEVNPMQVFKTSIKGTTLKKSVVNNDVPKENIQEIELEFNTSKSTTEIDNIIEKEYTFNYIPEEYIYPSEYTDTITIDGTIYKIIDDNGELNGLRTYIVETNGMKYKFLWYSKERFKNYSLAKNTLLYATDNLQIKKITFIPNKILEDDKGFGYIINVPAKHFHSFKNIINNTTKFDNINSIENTAINLINLFNKLSKYGMNLYNFDENSLTINTHTGSISMDIIGAFTINHNVTDTTTYKYLSPETNTNNTLSEESTRYSLMVILFRLLYHDHPLDGYKVISSIDLESQKRWYAEEALFNMSHIDTSNHAVRGVHYQLLGLWNKYPNYIKNVFINFFDNFLYTPLKRYSYDYILLIFKHLQVMSANCTCGYTDFLQNIKFTRNGFECPKCKNIIEFLYFTETKRSIPIKANSNIYLSFVAKSYTSDDVIGTIIYINRSNPVYEIKNLTKIPWNYSNAVGDVKVIEPNGTAILSNNAIIDIGYTRILVNCIRAS